VLVFIDESGDAGFKLSKGSSPIFAVGMVMLENTEAAQKTQAVIDELKKKLGIKPEFKFSKSSDCVRDAFFAGVRGLPFKIRAIVVQKDLIYSPNLRTDKENFYRFFLKSMMKFNNGSLQHANVTIDGSGDKEFRRDLEKHLRRHTTPGAIAKIRLMNSKSDPLLQLADMCIGAIARSYRADKEDADRWRRGLSAAIEDVWEFQ
jgi:hypothetical protein